ncbi:MAG: LysR family transcriptional regulator [Leptolyngbya sp. SIO3F4]|nr:LysR family transcriptional regulator [Leptolyngbya sp. SIO3F4]
MKRVHVTLAQIQAFAAVVDVGSFTLASEQLGMTQSAVSHAVAALERELQVSLVERDRNGIRLTDIGQRVLIHARAMLTSAERIRQETSAALGLQTGRIRLGSFPSVTAHFLPGLLRQFRQRYPGIEVVLFEGTDDEVREWIYTRVVDVGTVVLPVDGLATVSIAQDESLAVVAANHRLAGHYEIHIRELSQEPFIMSKSGCKPLITAMFRQAKTTPKTQFNVIDLRTIFAMIQEGMGVTIVPEMALPSDCSGLHVMSLSPKQFRQLAFAVPSLDTATPAVTEFLNEAKVWMTSLT